MDPKFPKFPPESLIFFRSSLLITGFPTGSNMCRPAPSARFQHGFLHLIPSYNISLGTLRFLRIIDRHCLLCFISHFLLIDNLILNSVRNERHHIPHNWREDHLYGQVRRSVPHGLRLAQVRVCREDRDSDQQHPLYRT